MLRWEHAPPLDDQRSVAPPIILDLSPPLHSPVFTLHSSVGGFLFSYATSALILGLALLVGWTWKTSRERRVVQDAPLQVPGTCVTEAPLVGRITGMAGCRWSKWSVVSRQWSVVTESLNLQIPKSPNPNLLVTLGAKYNLTSGFMEITYDTGAKVIIKGPCTYEVESASSGFLSLGKLTARVEAKGQGQVRGEGRANRQPNPLSKRSGHQPLRSPHAPHPAIALKQAGRREKGEGRGGRASERCTVGGKSQIPNPKSTNL